MGSSQQPSGGLVPTPNRSDLGISLPEDEVQREISFSRDRFLLNEEQIEVLKRIARVVFNHGAEEPIILLHGVFGSSKSTLLVR